MKKDRSGLWIAVAGLGLVVLLFLAPLMWRVAEAAAVLGCVSVGWLQFLRRNIPQMAVNWPLIVTGMICSVLAVVLGNGLLRSLFRQAGQSSPPDRPSRQWRWRWTICIYGAIWLLFMIAFGSTGIVRHSAWLVAYPEPWYQNTEYSYVELGMAGVCIRQLVMDNNEDLEPTRKAFRSQRSIEHPQSLLSDQFNVIFYSDMNNKVAAYLVIPRNPRWLEKAGFAASTDGAGDHVKPASQLQATIAQLDATYPPKGL